MKISVALATFNGAKFIQEQLASLSQQTFLPDELVVSDDGSTDQTLQLISAFAETAEFPVRILDKRQRLGFADNFLHAIENCRHELVALCDQDDVWLPNKIEMGVRRIIEDGSLLSMHTLSVVDEALRPSGFELTQGIDGDALIPALMLNPFGTGWGNTMIVRRELASIIPRAERPAQPGKREQPLSHDTWLFALAAALGPVSQIAAPLVLYRQHGATATVEARKIRRSLLSRIIKVPIAEYRERRWFDAEMSSIMERISSGESQFAAAALRAHERFQYRGAVWDARIDALAGNTLAIRAAGYQRHQQLLGSDQHWIGSRLKDIILGVTGVVRRIEAAN